MITRQVAKSKPVPIEGHGHAAGTAPATDQFGGFDADDFDATWTNNSIGYISSATAAYSLAVLSDGNVSDEAGRQIVSQTSRLVVEALLG
mgnify:CR=1 FL=1